MSQNAVIANDLHVAEIGKTVVAEYVVPGVGSVRISVFKAG
jgi:hypothetical protein